MPEQFSGRLDSKTCECGKAKIVSPLCLPCLLFESPVVIASQCELKIAFKVENEKANITVGLFSEILYESLSKITSVPLVNIFIGFISPKRACVDYAQLLKHLDLPPNLCHVCM